MRLFSRDKINQQKITLEPEEVFLDSEKSRDSRLETPIKPRNFILSYVVMLGLCLFFLLVLCYYQILRPEYYTALAEKNHSRIVSESANRGVIYDRFGEQLVFNNLRYDLVLNLEALEQQPQDKQKITSFLCEFLKKPLAQVRSDIDRWLSQNESRLIVLKRALSHEDVLFFKENFPDELSPGNHLTGLYLVANLARYYADATYFSHILGYTSQINKEELNQWPDYLYFEKIGRSGLEASYQDILRGEPSKQEMMVDAQGQILELFKKQDSRAGKSLVLSLDSGLQKFITEVLKNKLIELKLKHAVALVQDSQNGQILALVSLPNYDNNQFSFGLDEAAFRALTDDADQPLFNRAITGLYPPGSTIKPFLGNAVLEEKIISPFRVINCTGGISITNQFNPEIVYYFRDYRPHGPVDFFSAISQSCNSYFYMVGGGYGDIKGLGPNRIERYLKLFNFGLKTQIDLPGEASGLVPTPQWKEAQKGEMWYTGDTYHLSIGQGDLLVTPLQLTNAMSSLANGGHLWQPRLVKEIIDENKNVIEVIPAQLLNENFINQENLNLVRTALRQAVTKGLLHSLADLAQPIAGKTGTAEFGNSEETHAWFVGFGPYEKPEITVSVLVESGGLGGQSAVPLAKKIFEWYFENRLQ